ncbi:MAG: cyclic nucleotide-binding domain-containing protein [Planctomycetota bacterium]
MTDETTSLGKLPEFTDLTPEETTALASLGEPREVGPDETVFEQGDAGGKLYAIESGSVAMVVTLADGVEKHHVTLPAGAIFGTLAFADGGRQSATARTTEASRITVIGREDFDAWCDDHPATAVKLFRYLFETSAAQSRLLIDKYIRTIEWNLEITAAADLNLRRLVEDRAELSLELVSGKTVRGTLLQFDASSAGHELLLGTPEGGITVVPYHAVALLQLVGEAGDEVA